MLNALLQDEDPNPAAEYMMAEIFSLKGYEVQY